MRIVEESLQIPVAGAVLGADDRTTGMGTGLFGASTGAAAALEAAADSARSSGSGTEASR